MFLKKIYFLFFFIFLCTLHCSQEESRAKDRSRTNSSQSAETSDVTQTSDQVFAISSTLKRLYDSELGSRRIIGYSDESVSKKFYAYIANSQISFFIQSDNNDIVFADIDISQTNSSFEVTIGDSRLADAYLEISGHGETLKSKSGKISFELCKDTVGDVLSGNFEKIIMENELDGTEFIFDGSFIITLVETDESFSCGFSSDPASITDENDSQSAETESNTIDPPFENTETIFEVCEHTQCPYVPCECPDNTIVNFSGCNSSNGNVECATSDNCSSDFYACSENGGPSEGDTVNDSSAEESPDEYLEGPTSKYGDTCYDNDSCMHSVNLFCYKEVEEDVLGICVYPCALESDCDRSNTGVSLLQCCDIPKAYKA